nr:retrotransposon protein, putative, unclassified [Tanacetum cinerariifolium]
MIATPREPDLPVPVLESFHEQTDEVLTENDIKQMDADDPAIQTILWGLLEDVYDVVDSCETAKEVWERVRQMMKDINDPTESINTALILFAKAFQLTTPTNNNQRTSSNPRNRQIAQLGIANRNGTGNIVAARAEGTGNGNQVRCYNCRGLGHIARNCTSRPRRRDVAYLQTQLLIAQKEEARIQVQAEEFDFMAAACDLDEIEEVNANCILMANLQHASTSGTQLNKAPVYDIDGSVEVQLNDNCYNNDIFNMFTQEEHMVQSGGTIETSSTPNEEIRAHQETVYRNLIDQVAQEKYDKLEKCYQKSVYQEQCLTRKINALHLSSAKQITTLNDEISNLNKQLSKEKSIISSLMKEKKRLKHDFKTQEDKYLDKEVNLEAKIKDLENILLKRDQRVQTMHMLNPKPDSFYHLDKKMALVHNWSSSAHKEVHKIISPEIAPIINQVDARVQTFKIQFMKEVAKFVRDFKSLVKEAIESLDKQKSLELKIERLLKVSVSHHIMSVVQNGFVDVPSDLQTELDHTKEKLEHCIIKKEKEYDVLWNNWYTKSEECKYDNISYDKAYNYMQQKIERLQAQLGDLKGKSSDTTSASNTLDPLNQKLETNIMELEFQVVNYEREIRHLKTMYKNLFDSITFKREHAKLHNLIYENAKLRAQLFKNTSESMSNTSGTSVTPQVVKPKLIVVIPYPKKLHASITSHSVPQPREFNVVKHSNVIAPRMFKIDPSQTSRKNVSSDMVNSSSTGLAHSARTRRPQPKGETLASLEIWMVLTSSKAIFLQISTLSISMTWPQLLLYVSWLGPLLVSRGYGINLSHLNFNTINDLAKNDLVSGLPKFKYAKEHLCPSCEQGKSKRASHPPKPVSNSKQWLHLLHMDLCGPMRVASINSKWYVLVIVDDYSRYTWVHFLRTKDETPENDHEDIGKLGAKGGIGFFFGYSANSVAYRVYNRRTKKIIKTMNVTFDELLVIAFEQNFSKPSLQSLTSGQISSGLELTYAPSTITPLRPSEHNLDILFESFHNEYLGGQPSKAPRTVPAAPVERLQAQLRDLKGKSSNTPSASNTLDPLNKKLESKIIELEFQVENVSYDMVNASSTGLVHTARTRRPQPKGNTRNARVPSASKSSEVKKIVTVEDHRRISLLSKNQKTMSFECNNIKLAIWNDKYESVCGTCKLCLVTANHDACLFSSMNALNSRANNLCANVPIVQIKRDIGHRFIVSIIPPISLFSIQLNSTLFTKCFDDDILVVQVYVDDIIFGSTNPRYSTLFSDLMKSRFEMSMMGEMPFFFGLQVNQSPSGIFINQSNYVNEILKKYGLNTCDIIGTPMDIKDKLDLDQIGTSVDATKYRSMIGALMYLTSSRPDIVHATCICARYQAQPTKKHLKELTDYGYHFNKIPIYCDSKSATVISCNPVQHYRTKHIAVRYHFIKEHIEKGMIKLYFVKTDYQLADIFTKALPVDIFNYLVRRLVMRSLCPQELDRLTKLHQNRRDLPKDTPIDRLEVLRYDIGKRSKVRMGIMPTKTEFTLEQTQQDIEKVAVRSSLRSPNNKSALIKCRANEINLNLTRTQSSKLLETSHTMKSRNNLKVLRIILVIMPEHQSDIFMIFTMTMEILLEPTSSKLLVGEIGDSIWIKLMTLDINLGLE